MKARQKKERDEKNRDSWHPNHYFSPSAFRTVDDIIEKRYHSLSLSLHWGFSIPMSTELHHCTSPLWSRDFLSSLLFTLYLSDTRFSAFCLISHPFFFLNNYRESFCHFPYCFFSSPLSSLLSLLTSSNLFSSLLFSSLLFSSLLFSSLLFSSLLFSSLLFSSLLFSSLLFSSLLSQSHTNEFNFFFLSCSFLIWLNFISHNSLWDRLWYHRELSSGSVWHVGLWISRLIS